MLTFLPILAGKNIFELCHSPAARTIVKETQSYLTDLNTIRLSYSAWRTSCRIQEFIYGDQNRASLLLEYIPENRFDAVSFLNRKPKCLQYYLRWESQSSSARMMNGRTVFKEHIVQLVGIVEEVHATLF